LVWTGRTREELDQDGWLICVHPDDRERMMDSWEELVKTQRSGELHYRIVDTHGRVAQLFSKCYALKTEEGKFLGWRVIAYRCAAEACLRNPDFCPYAVSTGGCPDDWPQLSSGR
jgi:hypothetical protein